MLRRWNSTFKIKSQGDAAKPSLPLLRGKRRSARSTLKAGARMKAWESTRARLKVKFAAQGIVTCELGYPGCKRDDWLSFAHGRKRRKLIGDELETLTILACTPCHDVIERMAPEGMLAIVQSVISERGIL